MEELLGLEQPRDPTEAPPDQGNLDVVIKETIKETIGEAGNGTTPSGGLNPAANTSEGESEQAMETEGPVSPVSSNEDDLLTGTTTTDVEADMTSLHVTSPERQGDNEGAAT